MRNSLRKRLFGVFFGIIASVFALHPALAANGVNASLSMPTSFTLSPTETIDVPITLNTDGAGVSGVDIILNFDQTKLHVVSVTPTAQATTTFKSFTPVDGTGAFSTSGIISSANTSGKLSFGAETYDWSTSSTTASYNGTTTLATIRFQAIAAGSSAISFAMTPGATNDTNIVKDATPVSDLLTSSAQITNSTVTSTYHTITGHVYVDTNNNGFQDAGEPNYPNATVTLSGGSGSVLTNATGDYSFSNLLHGISYTTTITVPGGYTAPVTSQTSTLNDDTQDNYTLVPIPTNTPTPAPTNTPTPLPTATPTPLPTNTPIPTATPVPPTNTPVPTATPTLTPTPTPIPTYFINGHVYVDTNNNGFQDAGEPDYAGATITLSGGGVGTLQTDVTGTYKFANLMSGRSYTVTLTVPSGYQAPVVSETTANLTGNTTYNFTFVPNPTATPVPTAMPTPLPTNTPTPIPTSTPVPPTNTPTPTTTPLPSATPTPTPIPTHNMTGNVFVDTNQNGFIDAGEIASVNTQVQVVGGVTHTTRIIATDVTGQYVFTSLPDDTYTVHLFVPSDYTLSAGTPANDVQIPVNGANTNGPLFGIVPIPTATPTPLPTATPTPVPTNTPIPTATPVPPTATPTPTHVPTPTNTIVPTATVVPPTNTPAPTATPTPVPVFTITGNVYVDRNGNGFKDEEDTNYPSATVTLSGPAGGVQATNVSGNYTFANLTAGVYTVTVTVPNGYDASTLSTVSDPLGPSTTTDFAIHPIPTPTLVPSSTPIPTPTAIPTSTGVPTVIASTPTAIPTAIGGHKITGQLFIDTDGDGLYSAGDSVLANTSVSTITDAGTLSATTDEQGNYTLDNLPDGTFVVTFTLPEGYVLPTDQANVAVVHAGDVTDNIGVILAPTPTQEQPQLGGGGSSSGGSSGGSSSGGSSSGGGGSSSSSSSPSTRSIGDLNGDGHINIFDLSLVLSHFGQRYSGADVNGDGIVNIFDLSIILSHFGK